MYSISALKVFFDDGDGGFYLNVFDQLKIEGKQIAPNTFILTQQAGTARMDSIARYSNNNGTKMLSAIYGDTLGVDSNVIIMMVALALYAIALLWSVITLLSNIIRFIIRKLKKKKGLNDSFKKHQIILCVAIIALILNIILIASIMLTMEASLAAFIPCIIASIILGLIPIIYAIIFIKNRNKLSCTKRQKLSYAITMCMGFIMTFTVLALELYRL